MLFFGLMQKTWVQEEQFGPFTYSLNHSLAIAFNINNRGPSSHKDNMTFAPWGFPSSLWRPILIMSL